MKKIIVVCVLLVLLVGCNEAQRVPAGTEIKPLNQQISQAPQEWQDAYGDTLEAQIAFNLVVLHKNDLVIANVMNRMHSIDPNDPNNLKLRIEKLETRVYNSKEK